jgi:hypothetical protein
MVEKPKVSLSLSMGGCRPFDFRSPPFCAFTRMGRGLGWAARLGLAGWKALQNIDCGEVSITGHCEAAREAGIPRTTAQRRRQKKVPQNTEPGPLSGEASAPTARAAGIITSNGQLSGTTPFSDVTVRAARPRP